MFCSPAFFRPPLACRQTAFAAFQTLRFYAIKNIPHFEGCFLLVSSGGLRQKNNRCSGYFSTKGAVF